MNRDEIILGYKYETQRDYSWLERLRLDSLPPLSKHFTLMDISLPLNLMLVKQQIQAFYRAFGAELNRAMHLDPFQASLPVGVNATPAAINKPLLNRRTRMKIKISRSKGCPLRSSCYKMSLPYSQDDRISQR